MKGIFRTITAGICHFFVRAARALFRGNLFFFEKKRQKNCDIERNMIFKLFFLVIRIAAVRQSDTPLHGKEQKNKKNNIFCRTLNIFSYICIVKQSEQKSQLHKTGEENMKTLNEMRELVENKTAQLLTIENAKTLRGQKIQTIYFGYRGQDNTDEFIVGDVVSELEYYRNLKEDCYPDGRFNNRAEYWESYMTKEQLEACRNKMMLIAADGRKTFIYGYGDDDVMQCSDDYRYVYYIIAE